MSAVPVWFGEHSQFGWLHLPSDGTARAGVMLCPPLGMESAWSHRAFRLMAESLEADGFAVLRFDLPGSGHSAGDLRENWPADVLRAGFSAALAFLRETGVESVAVVGFRLGATLAATALTTEPAGGPGRGGPEVEALVLWDPCLSGRAFLREQKAIRLMAVGPDSPDEPGTAPDGEATVSGYCFPPPARDEIENLDLMTIDSVSASRVLVLPKPGLSDRARTSLLARLGGDWTTAAGTEDLLFNLKTPDETMAEITRWLAVVFPPDGSDVSVPPHHDQLILAPSGDSAVVETPVRVGPLGLFGLEAAPVAGGTAGHPTVIFLNTSYEPCIGPGRLWVSLSRKLAASGRRTVRVDLSGLGDSPARPGQARFVNYQPEAIEDAVDVVRWIAGDDPTSFVLVGSCSGGYNSLQAARLLGGGEVCAVNPVLDRPIVDRPAPSATTQPSSIQHLGAWSPRRRWLEWMKKRGFRRLRPYVPELAWHALHLSRLQRSPAHGLRGVAAGGTRMLLVCGPADARNFDWRGGWITRGLERAGQLRFVTVPYLDHALLTSGPQQVAGKAIFEYLMAGDRAPGSSDARQPGAVLTSLGPS